jgi:N-glycosylase/DNA lyase
MSSSSTLAFQPPRPPPGYTPLAVSSSQILLQLTISNKCGQAFRWHGVDVYEPIEYIETVKKEEGDIDTTSIKTEETTRTYNRTTEWSMCLSDRIVFVRQDVERGYIYFKTLMGLKSTEQIDPANIETQTAAWLNDYLNLDVPLASLYEEWSEKDKVFSRFAKRFGGVRMLRQDPWETLCAFICSSNNNIARIGQMVQNLCTHFSPPMATVTYPPPPREVFAGDEEVQAMPTTVTYFPFPSVERLAEKDIDAKLRKLSFGYRAPYIQDTARLLLEIVASSKDQEEGPAYDSPYQYLHSLRSMDYPSARQELIRFPGVGPKVADCILLMAMDQPSSIPVDRHVFQFAERWYKIRTKGGHKGYEHIADTFRQLWGPYAGWAHSVLFTADLRAFQTYKVEEIENTIKDGIAHSTQVKREIVVKEEEKSYPDAEKEPVINDRKKRTYHNLAETPTHDRNGTEITKAFKDTKKRRSVSAKKETSMIR